MRHLAVYGGLAAIVLLSPPAGLMVALGIAAWMHATRGNA